MTCWSKVYYLNMRYVEYIYLSAALMMVMFAILEYEYLVASMLTSLVIASVICISMYFLRRKRRKKIDDIRRKEIEQLEKELESTS